VSKRRYIAMRQGQHPQTGVLLRCDAVFDADFGRSPPSWAIEAPPKTELTDGNPEPNTPKRGEPRQRAPQLSYSRDYPVF